MQNAVGLLGGEATDFDWAALKEQRLEFFESALPLCRLSLPPTSSDVLPGVAQLIEGGGAQRWFKTDEDVDALRARLADHGASLCAFRGHAETVAKFQPLPAAMLKLQRNIKSSFDPAGIFNPGRMYPGL